MDRYVVARHCNGGIGDHLSCLIGAWWLARRTNRTLVVDWRGSRFNSDPSMSRNCFLDYFECGPSLLDVRVIADDRVAAIDYPLPIWPAKWSRESLAACGHLKHTGDEVAAVNGLVTSSSDPPEPTIVLNQWIEPPPPQDAVRMMLGALQPSTPIRDAVEPFWQQHVGLRPTIAIHIRHGNGENVGLRSAYWLSPWALTRQLAANTRNDVHREGTFGRFADNMPPSLVGTDSQESAERRLCARVAAEFRDLARSLGKGEAKPFLFCDSAQIVEIMRQILPDLLVWPKTLLGKGEGPLHQASFNKESASGSSAVVSDKITRDMFIELELMNRCGGLVYMDSGFSIMARTRLAERQMRRLKPTMINRLIVRAFSR